MKCVLLFCFVAFCYAVPTVPTVPNVQFGEDGTITITGADGKKVVISKSVGNDGQKNVEISLPDPLGATKTIKVNQDFNQRTVNIEDSSGRYKRSSVSKSSKESKKSKSEAEILDEIFKDYQGAVDLKSYEKVLKEIDGYVKSGDLDSSIYEILKSFAQYDALNPEGSPGPSKIGYSPSIANSQRLLSLQNYLNKVIGEQQQWNGGWYGSKQPLEMSQGPMWYKGAQWQLYGPNGESLQQYRQPYGPVQNKLIQDGQQNYLPSSVPYQQQQQQLYQPQQQLYQPQQQLILSQSQLNSPRPIWALKNQQSGQDQGLGLSQQLSAPQQQQSQMLPQPQRQQNSLGQDWAQLTGQLPQQLPWSQVQQQYPGLHQQYYEPQQKWGGLPLSQGKQLQQQPQQQYQLSQQQYNLPVGQQSQLPKQNLVYPQQLQQNLNGQVWTVPNQQTGQDLQVLNALQDQQVQRPNWYYSLKPQANQLNQLQYPINLQGV